MPCLTLNVQNKKRALRLSFLCLVYLGLVAVSTMSTTTFATTHTTASFTTMSAKNGVCQVTTEPTIQFFFGLHQNRIGFFLCEDGAVFKAAVNIFSRYGHDFDLNRFDIATIGCDNIGQSRAILDLLGNI